MFHRERVWLRTATALHAIPTPAAPLDAGAHVVRVVDIGQVFQLADRVKVRVVAVNLDDRKIDFELVENGMAYAVTFPKNRVLMKR